MPTNASDGGQAGQSDTLIAAAVQAGAISRDEGRQSSEDFATHWEAAQAAWPQLGADIGLYAKHLAQALKTSSEPLAALRDMRSADLYLAFACGTGSALAIGCFETAFFPDIPSVVAGNEGLSVADVSQMLRERLFSPRAEKGPRILQYSGRGKLRTWFRMVLVRTVLNATRGHREEAIAPEEIAERALAHADPELAVIRATYLREFTTSFAKAIEELSGDKRRLLYHSIVDELSIDQIARIYGIHRATAARRLVAARDALATKLREHLEAQLGVEGSALDSILRAIRSRIDLTMERYLRESGLEDAP